MRLQVAMLITLSACDPGWTYHVPGGRLVMDNGAGRDEVAGPAQTLLRARATVFTSNLWTSLVIENSEATPLVIRPDKIRMLDCDSTSLPFKRSSAEHPIRCSGRATESEVTLGRGESCTLDVDFEVVPDPIQLSRLTMVHDGVQRASTSVPIAITLESNAAAGSLGVFAAIPWNRSCWARR